MVSALRQRPVLTLWQVANLIWAAAWLEVTVLTQFGALVRAGMA